MTINQILASIAVRERTTVRMLTGKYSSQELAVICGYEYSPAWAEAEKVIVNSTI